MFRRTKAPNTQESPAQPVARGNLSSPTAAVGDLQSSVSTMTPSTAVDVFFLTFNCAKNFIDVPVFATHLHTAFKQRAELPDLVVFSLQEVAPIAYSFIGSYFLNPYLTRYEEALNLAADAVNNPESQGDALSDHGPASLLSRVRLAPPVYTLVRSKNVGMTSILLFARDSKTVADIQEAEVGFGTAEMGNKGAVGLRIVYEPLGTDKSSEMTFVATHLAAMEWNLARRNANWAAIMRGLTFDNPEKILRPREASASSSTGASPADSENEHVSVEEAVRLLHDQHNEETLFMQEKLHDISVFKPTSHLFIGGDLNYRISTTSPPPDATFPSLDPESEHYYPRFFPLDQLTRERLAGRTLHGLSEHKVDFPPTYKYDIVSEAGKPTDPLTVPWKFAPHRYPSWTDRILFLDVAPWTKARLSNAPEMKVQAYDCMPVVASSDHRPVFLRVDVPIIDREDLIPPRGLENGVGAAVAAEWNSDPRMKLPVTIDPEAWERRMAARKKEVVAGWSMFLWSTQEGALILGTLMVAMVGGWWLYNGW
ncbi:hypothetical protein jhhlp_003780 [Lomentospora prolificans]|uniref:Inositol polyphosphate-related phosphatase domain-containing protein n=1 Tax=Lomentospora prolificans TaxID=41688 RepID=A0A2N3N9P2_9PEZI|nr:hypothetical protein jhhlp_003780 [Lomentospora prolificans]